MISDARDFLDALAETEKDGRDDTPTASSDKPVRLAVVDPAYSGSGAAKVTFEGEGSMGTRTYLSIVAIAPSDRVVLIPVGRTYLIVGNITQTAVLPYRSSAGVVANASVGANTTVITAVSFPSATRFTVAPIVVAVVSGGAGSLARSVAVDAVTTTGFDLRRANSSAGSLSFGASWQAVQMTPTAAGS